MTRHAHLWFILGIMIALPLSVALWLGAVLAGELWSTRWGWVLPSANLLVFAYALYEYRRRWKHQWTGYRPMSHEMRCRWDFARRQPEPACARRRRDSDWHVSA